MRGESPPESGRPEAQQAASPKLGTSKPGTGPQLFSWALYDWATSPFFAVIITFVFATYFTEAVAPDSIDGTAYWGYALSASALIVALVSPALGAIADVGRRRKPWLAAFTLLSAMATALLWFVEPNASFILLALVLLFLANTTIELGQAFYNAMLADLAPPATLGRWSGWGWCLGYIAGIAALLLLLLGFIQAEPPPFGLDADAAEPVRIAGPIVALWLVVFALPLFLVTPDRAASGTPLREALGEGLGRLWRTLKALGWQSQIVRFLIARLIYIDGLNTLFAFGGIYAAGTFGMASEEIIYFAIALNITAGLGALGFGFLDDRMGSKTTVLVAIGGLVAFGIAALLVQEKSTFWAIGVVIGLFVGPAQSASRTLMARLAPPAQRTEMFGLYALSGKLTAFLGPFLFGTATALFGTQRAGMAVVVLLLLTGGLLLFFTVREPDRER